MQVLYEHFAEIDDDLTLRPGDIITDVIKTDDGWWYGDLRERRGFFPANFVKVSPFITCSLSA